MNDGQGTCPGTLQIQNWSQLSPKLAGLSFFSASKASWRRVSSVFPKRQKLSALISCSSLSYAIKYLG